MLIKLFYPQLKKLRLPGLCVRQAGMRTQEQDSWKQNGKHKNLSFIAGMKQKPNRESYNWTTGKSEGTAQQRAKENTGPIYTEE